MKNFNIKDIIKDIVIMILLVLVILRGPWYKQWRDQTDYQRDRDKVFDTKIIEGEVISYYISGYNNESGSFYVKCQDGVVYRINYIPSTSFEVTKDVENQIKSEEYFGHIIIYSEVTGEYYNDPYRSMEYPASVINID